MGLITKEVEVKLKKGIKYYEQKGYEIPKIKTKWGDISVPKGTTILVKVEDLSKGSHVLVDVNCDGCGEKINNISWKNYNKLLHFDGNIYCKKCANNGYRKWISFEQWCFENNRQDILDRWDYKLNICSPSEITYGTTKKYYFKCPRVLHESELKSINSFTNGQEGSMFCKACNSFAQWGIDHLGENFLDKYWDWEKNTVDPWKIMKSCAEPKVWIKCQEKDYHGSYDISPSSFINNHRCPYCTNRSGKVHYLDSLGVLYPEVLNIWSDKNKKSPYEYPPMSNQETYWKCLEGIHSDYSRKISESNRLNFRCPDCNFSKGEEKVNNYLINDNWLKFSKDITINSNNKYYIPQKTFNNLVGINNGLLSYDFYLPIYNLLIEYQGEMHERFVKGIHKSKKDFEKQQEHDRRKREYAKNNNIILLEIWYWDFDNIEFILEEYLKSIKDVMFIA